jgi:hypothetical protein
MMRAILKLGAPVAVMIAVGALGAMTAKQAIAGEFCRQDVTGHMTGCGYDTLAQCQAASAGIGGDCFRDPNKNDNRNAFAYQPNSPHLKKGVRSQGSPANANQ